MVFLRNVAQCGDAEIPARDYAKQKNVGGIPFFSFSLVFFVEVIYIWYLTFIDFALYYIQWTRLNTVLVLRWIGLLREPHFLRKGY